MSQDINSIIRKIINKVEHFTAANEGVAKKINMISLNASIEAARIGESGAAFAVVANEVKKLAEQAHIISQNLRQNTLADIESIAASLEQELQEADNTRLSEMALTLVQLIVRNLFERTADVRWWATDEALLQALKDTNDQTIERLHHRLQLINRFYSVYFDLVVVDDKGKVVSSSGIEKFSYAPGTDLSNLQWVRSALSIKSSDDYVAEPIQPSVIHQDKIAAVYAAAIMKNGELQGKPIGALGAYFNWEDQASIIVKEERSLTEKEWERTRILLLDSSFQIIADSEMKELFQPFPLQTGNRNKGTYIKDDHTLVAFAQTIGYQEYDGLGWYGVVIQEKKDI